MPEVDKVENENSNEGAKEPQPESEPKPEEVISKLKQLSQQDTDRTLKILHQEVDNLQYMPGKLRRFLLLIEDVPGHYIDISNMLPAEKIGYAKALIDKVSQKINLR